MPIRKLLKITCTVVLSLLVIILIFLKLQYEIEQYPNLQFY